MSLKVGSRTLTIVCVAVCVVLAIGLVGAVWNYTSIISARDNTIATQDTEISSLNDEIASLNAQLSSNSSIINLGEQKTLSTNQAVSLAAKTYTVLVYATPYAGYLSIAFSSSVTVYFMVENSRTSMFYGRYPPFSPDNATSGTFIMPVLPDVTMIAIYNPTQTDGAAIQLTVRYIY